MRQIANAAGISKSLLYHYFPSKTELFKAAVQQHAEVLRHQRVSDDAPFAASVIPPW